ncbi:hypothetical protein BDV3_000181 [Batrachochytrium dendrobatidis]|nr:hypothetical protein BDEG_21198 [Batrachochytrium dendrobatidis JEL423]
MDSLTESKETAEFTQQSQHPFAPNIPLPPCPDTLTGTHSYKLQESEQPLHHADAAHLLHEPPSYPILDTAQESEQKDDLQTNASESPTKQLGPSGSIHYNAQPHLPPHVEGISVTTTTSTILEEATTPMNMDASPTACRIIGSGDASDSDINLNANINLSTENALHEPHDLPSMIKVPESTLNSTSSLATKSMATLAMSLMSLDHRELDIDGSDEHLPMSYGSMGIPIAVGSTAIGGGESVASSVMIGSTTMSRAIHTEKMSSILKKSEVLKEMEEDSRRKRAISHRSIDFLGARNMRRSKDLLEEAPSGPLPSLPAWGETQPNQKSSMGGLGRPVSSLADSGVLGRTSSISEKITNLVRSGSGNEPILFQKIFKNLSGSAGTNTPMMDTAGASSPNAPTGNTVGMSGDIMRRSPITDTPGLPTSVSASSPAPGVTMPNSFTALNVTALRKNRMSTMAAGGPMPPPALAAPSQTSSKPALNAKTFKEWYINILSESDVSASTHAKLAAQVAGVVELQNIFGKKEDVVNPVERLMWVAKEYDVWRKDPQWNIPEKALSPHETAQEDMAVRMIDIVPDGRIPGLEYDDAIAEGDLDIVVLGTVKDLMDGLIFPLDQDMSFSEIFLASYRFFMPPQELLESLIGWYNADASETRLAGSEAFLRKNRKYIQIRAVRVLLTWIRNHWHDFHNNQCLYAELNFFVDYLAKVSFGNNQKLTQAIREQRLSWYTYQYIPMFSGIRSSVLEHTRPWIAEWEIDDFSQNLTMIDHLFFRQLKPDMYLQILHKPASIQGGGFNVPFKAILDFCHWFRTVVGYTATVIAKEDNIKKKTNYIKRFIKVARACKELSNYNTMFAIIYGLKRPAVLMWTQAWEGLATRYMDLFKELDRLTDPANGHFNYSDEITQREPPAVPFMLPYIQDMIQTHVKTPQVFDDENKDDNNKRRINFQKFYHIYSIAAELEVFRLSSYHRKLKGDRESNMLLVNHMRSYTMLDGKALGEGLVFSSTNATSDWNETASGASGSKAMKRASQILSSTVAVESANSQ